MVDKQKKLVIEFEHANGKKVILPEGAYVQFTPDYVNAYKSSWDISNPILQFKRDKDTACLVYVDDLSEDEELVEKVKKLSKDEMNTLRNIMDSVGLLDK